MQKNAYFGKNKNGENKKMAHVTVEAVHTHTHTCNIILNKSKHKHTLYLCDFCVCEIM